MQHKFLYIVVFILSLSCVKKDEEKKIIAKVYDTFLYKDEVTLKLPVNLSKEDSVIFVKNYINSWAKEQLLIQKAKINLQEEKEQINALVNQYEQDLLINKYKEAVVMQELDTLVTVANIEKFYTENKEIFKLNEALVKFRYIYFGNGVLNPKEIISLFKDDNQASDQELIKQELQFKSLSLNDSIWIKYDDVMRTAPYLRAIDKSSFLKKKKMIQKKDSIGAYLVKIKDVLLRNDIAPISYALPIIKQMILHKRKLELLNKIEETLIDDAIKNKEFQIY